MKIVLILAMAALAFLPFIAMTIEKKQYNNGHCPRCKTKYYRFDNDSQGGRGYRCRKCGYITWVSYPNVDRDFEELDL